MTAIPTKLPGVLLLEPDVHGDSRGWFYEMYSEQSLRELGIAARFVQDNRSFSARKGTLRGLHCQTDPFAQGKLFSCTRGAVWDVAVDVRQGSPTYQQWIRAELSAENKRQLWIPAGCLHGFVTLTDDVEVFYKVDALYSPAHDRSICWNDPAFGVDWGVESPSLSAKDAAAPLWKDADVRYSYLEQR
ncbi:MAG: dTDP-4-dehydrorhamnose 3,5-epimerase [Oscillospiraceae bacterium]|jgi:dTDP-4-dehydrorhamnose 3,5-epimerase|nr:dTDP-4-dehydrorhamnose 3,5-epimerase [Oscillospiraceae bacterium]